MKSNEKKEATVERTRGHLISVDRYKIAQAINEMGYDNLREFCVDRRLNYSTLYALLKRNETTCRAETLQHLATSLGMRPDELLNGPSIAALMCKLWT